MTASSPSCVCARFDDLEVDLRSGELRKPKSPPVRIQMRPLQVFRLLLEANGEVVSREQLRVALWPEAPFVDFEHGINTAIKKLRQVLQDSVESPRYIETLPKIGYRFIRQVEWVVEPTNTTPHSEMASPTTVVEPPRSRHFLTALLLGTLALVAGGTILVLAHRNRRPTSDRLTSIPPQATISERRLTANPEDTPVISAVISPDGRYLAYTDSTGIYLRAIDSGETHPVPLQSGFDAVVESWFPDSAHMIVSSVETPERPPSLWRISILGGAPRKLADGGMSASVSPDGSQLAFLRDTPAGEEIWVMQADGSGARKLISSDKDQFSRMAWAPDGTKLAYARTKTRYYTSRSEPDTQIEIINLRNAETVLVQSIGERGLPRGGAAIGWLPDDRLIYPLREPRPNQQDTNLWWVQLDPKTAKLRGAATRITNGQGIAVQLSVSMDAKKIALRRHAPQPDIYIADLEPAAKRLTSLRRLTLDSRLDYATAWTPDSKAVLFHSNRDGTFKVFKQDISATHPVLLVGGKDDLYMPRLSPDGSSVLYVIRPGAGAPSDKAQVMRVSLVGGPPQFVLEDSGIWDIQCARRPATLCIYARIEAGRQTLFTFDPVKGKGAELRVEEAEGDTFDWCMSPNGKYIAWARNRAARERFGIRVYSLTNGSKRDIAVREWTEIYGLDWAPDSKSLWAAAYNVRRRALLHVGLDGNVRTMRNIDLQWAIPSPDGRHLAIVQNSNSANVWLLEKF